MGQSKKPPAVIEAADPDIIGNRIPQFIQCLDQIRSKVIGADKGIRHRFEPTYGFVQDTG